MKCGQCNKAWRQAAHDNADLAIARSQAWVSLWRQVYWAINAGHLNPDAILLFEEPAARGLKELPDVRPYILDGSDWKPNDSGPTQSRRTKGGPKASSYNSSDWSQWTGVYTGKGQQQHQKAYGETSGKGKGAGRDKELYDYPADPAGEDRRDFTAQIRKIKKQDGGGSSTLSC